MSFSLSTTAVIGDDLAAKIDEAVDAQTGDQIDNAKALGLFEAAKAHVAAVAPKVAAEGETVSISIYGHANPSTDPVPGWASNTVTVGITQVYKPA